MFSSYRLGDPFRYSFARCSSLSLHQSPSWATCPRGGAPSSPSSGPRGSHLPQHPVSMFHGHAAPCSTDTQLRAPRTHNMPQQQHGGATPRRVGTPALPATGPPQPRAWLLQDEAHSPPLVAECDPTCVGCTGKGPAQCRECITGYSKESGQCEGQRVRLLHWGAFPGAMLQCGRGPGEARSSCPHASTCPLSKQPPRSPAEPLPPFSNAPIISASVHK